MTEKRRNTKIYLLIMVGIISAFGPFVTDFYLPSFPAISKYFHTTDSLVQLSLTAGMVGLAFGQLIIGPLSDKYGRKRPLLASLVLFCIATLGCLFSPDIYWFVLFRLVQGLAGAGGVVISRSIATDLYEGRELSRFFSMLSSVQGLAPILAPVLGGFLLEVTDWRGIFWILLAIGVALIVTVTLFRESLSKEHRQQSGVFSTFCHYVPLLHNFSFMSYVLVQAFAMGVMFTYIAASPFIFQNHYGLTPVNYSLCFGANAISIMIGSLTVSFFRNPMRAMQLGVQWFCVMSIVVAVLLVADVPVLALEGALFCFLFFLGLILPSSTTLALGMERDNAGNASALLGFLMFIFGGILSPLAGLGNMLHTTGILVLVCAAGVWICMKLAFRMTANR